MLVSNDATIELLTRIKVLGRPHADNPCLAFASQEPCRFFMGARGIDDKQLAITIILDASKNANFPSAILIFASEQQILDSIASPEGFDYESLMQHFVNEKKRPTRFGHDRPFAH